MFPHTFFSGADDGYIVEWNTETKADGKLLVQVNRPVYSMYVNTSEHVIICGTASGNIHVIDLQTKKEVRNIEAHTLGVFDIQFVNNHYISSGGDGRICIWNNDFKLVHSIKAADKSARIIAIHPQLKEFAVGFSDHHIRIYSVSTYELLLDFLAHQNSVFALAYAPKGNKLYSGGRDVLLRNWNLHHAYEMELNIPAHTLHINAIAFSPDEKLFATVSMDKTIKIWDAQTDTLLKVIDKARNDGHVTSVNKILWLSENELITCSDDRTVMMWGIEEV